MTQDQLAQLEKTIAKSIETNVNGKIRILTDEFRDHKTVVNQYIVDDNDWKQRAEPVIMMGNNVRGFGKVSLYILGFVAAVTGAIISIIRLIKE